ncbi:GNAT family N-acetyltransferase [Aciduricibacillus chroicocephali]|uniref:GNAT family N-acetyltransferase n=1 Tax=Aciduricibacillus chroicocephali TaxID=3054939 RepID=A0ABY9KVT3_9BACI|nr:GNAT family N-acetyltransferase [Bacillaceae bacterium 44XB]
MKIKEVSLDSLKEAAELFNEYRKFYGKENDLLGAETFLKERIENGESIIFLAYEQEQAVGFVQIYPIFSSISMKRAYILNDLFVEPSYRGGGVGKAILNRVFNLCEENGGSYVTLQTSPDNHRAKGLYEHMGMSLDSEYDWYIKYSK